MRAAVFKGIGKKLVIEEMDDPVAGSGDVVMRVEACGVCGSDLHATQAGAYLQAEGTVLGHEFAGQVVQSGDPKVAVGMRATAVPVNACGVCDNCRAGYPMMCTQNLITGLSSVKGACAQFVKVPSRYVIPLPDSISYEIGALVEPMSVGLHAVTKAGVQIGDRVLIIGAGPIGLAVTAFARVAGAASIVVSERVAARAAAAKRMGATQVVAPASDEVLAKSFASLTGGVPDIVFDCVGAPGVIQSCINLSKPLGTVLVVGVCMVEDHQIPLTGILKELKLQYVLGYGEDHFKRVVAAIDSGMVDPSPLITNRVNLEDFPSAFEALRQPRGQIKLMVKPNLNEQMVNS